MKERMFGWGEWSIVVVLEMFLLLDYYTSRNTCLSITLADQTIRPSGQNVFSEWAWPIWRASRCHRCGRRWV